MARQQKTIHYIYKTTCLVTGRYYLGMHSTNNLDDGYMGSGKRLRYSIRKHGIENHVKEILEFFETRDLLIEAEMKAITPNMITDKDCMNLMSGGTGGFSSEEHRRRCIEAGGKGFTQKLKTDMLFRIKHRKIVTKNISKYNENPHHDKATFRNRKHSEESKKQIGEKNKIKQSGDSNSQYGTCWITKSGVNKKIKKEDSEIWLVVGWIKGRK